jgi:putative ATP-dependent endonuclease of the OLD family
MHLASMRLSNFQSFGPLPKTIKFDNLTFLIGSNGSGKTAALQALARLFGISPQLRGIRPSDFHADEAGAKSSNLYIEADFEFSELAEDGHDSAAVPDHFRHMQLLESDQLPRLRIRLAAQRNEDDEIDETMTYVLEVDASDQPTKELAVQRYERSKIQVHYLPARRDPTEHISYGAATMLGRVLRAADWSSGRTTVDELAASLGSDLLAKNPGVSGISDRLSDGWSKLHRGHYFSSPSVTFSGTSIDQILRNLTIGFSPGHGELTVPFSRLSDGQQSLLYLSLVLGIHKINQDIIAGELSCFDIAKLRVPTFTMVVMEEPENSLSPHYLGRVISALEAFGSSPDGQAVVATHSPAVLRRVTPDRIRYMRLGAGRQTVVKEILLPDQSRRTSSSKKRSRHFLNCTSRVWSSSAKVIAKRSSFRAYLLPIRRGTMTRLSQSCRSAAGM